MKLSQVTQFPRDKQIAADSAEIMRQVIYALIPGGVLSLFFYGVGVVIQLGLAMLTALLCEWLTAKLRRQRLRPLSCWTGLTTAALLTFSLPATAPWVVIVTAVAFGLLLGKHVYGGVGMNIFNPAMVGFCAVYLSFPAEMSVYPLQFVGFADTLSAIFADGYAGFAIDAVVGATALSDLKANGQHALSTNHFWWLNAAWLAGGVYLWVRDFADWRLSLTLIGVFVATTALFSVFSESAISFSQHIGLGALVFTACFIITDPTSAATGRKGRIIYAGIAGLLAVFIRQFGNMPDSLAFAVLLANLCVPLIDTYTRPIYYKGK